MDNSLDLDKEENVSKPKDLTVDEINEFQILLNKLWNMQYCINTFNDNFDKTFNDFQYVLKNIDPSIDYDSYFESMQENTQIFKDRLLDSYNQHREKIDYYLDILKEWKQWASWEHEWIKDQCINRIHPPELLQNLRNYFSNLTNFNLSSCLIVNDIGLFYDSVLGSEPIFVCSNDMAEEKEKLLQFQSNLTDLQRTRIRFYAGLKQLPKGAVANLIVWDYIHLIDVKSFEANVINYLYTMLRPGGVMTLNYPSIFNPADFDLIIRHIFGAYDPEHLEDLLTKVGFELIKHDVENQIFYVKKPGVLNTNKASPTISTIVNIDSLLQNK